MFGIGFSEFAVIGVVALIVLGPERLPKVARTAGLLFGRLQRYVNGVKADIAREMDTSELAKIKQEVQDAARSFEKTVQEHSTSIEAEARAVQQQTEKSLTDKAADQVIAAAPSAAPTIAAPTQAEILANEDAAFAAMAPIVPSRAFVPPVVHAQGSFDFGIEPARKHAARAP